MKHSAEGLKNRALWEEKGYILPAYDHEEVKKSNNGKSLLDSLWCW